MVRSTAYVLVNVNHVEQFQMFVQDVMLLRLGSASRIVLLICGGLQDRVSPVKYTDIDYNVFTDAAAYVTKGLSPYLRSTYRYSPLLAWTLVPNLLLHPAWGKVLFCAADLLAAW